MARLTDLLGGVKYDYVGGWKRRIAKVTLSGGGTADEFNSGLSHVLFVDSASEASLDGQYVHPNHDASDAEVMGMVRIVQDGAAGTGGAATLEIYGF